MLPASVELIRDVVFASPGGHKLRLDLFLPRSSEQPAPAVVYVAGGGWRQVNKEQFWRHAAHMATKGFVGATVEHRLSSDATFPAAYEDVKTAVRWLRANADRYGIDVDRIGAAGGSSGGVLMGMLGTMAHMPDVEGDGGNPEYSSQVRAIAAFSPEMDLVSRGKADHRVGNIARFLGKTYEEDPQLWAKASPLTHAGADSAPLLIVHGTMDARAPHQNSVGMREKLKAAGVEAELFTGGGAGHGFAMSPPWYEDTLRTMEVFFTRILK